MKYTTYLLGAGASFNAIPIYQNKKNNFSTKFCEFIEDKVINQNEFKEIKDSSGKKLNEYLKEMLVGILNHSTVDTYARKLYLKANSKVELRLLKIFISFYLEFVQCFQGKEVKLNIDSRYDVLFSNLLKKTDKKLSINESIRILSWNYDNQLELTLSLFSEESENIEKMYADFNIIPRRFQVNSSELEEKIIKLNGHAGHYLTNFDSHIEITSLFNWFSKIEHHNNNLIESLKTLFSPDFRLSYLINFAWETENPYSKLAINSARDLLNKTEKLIVIGYSFPGYNHDVDSQLLGALPEYSKVLYQSLESNSILARRRIKNVANQLEINNIQHTDYIDQFVLPSQFLSFFD